MKKSVLLCLFLVLMLLHADYVTEGAKYGLLLWYSSVVPALFPFMILSGLIVSGGGLHTLMAPFYLILHPLLGLSREGCYTLICGLLCGYPMGAKTCADFLREGRISVREGRFLMAICNHPSPMFLLGYVYPFFAAEMPLIRLLAAVYGPILPLAALARLVYRPGAAKSASNGLGAETSATVCTPASPSAASSADEAILSSVEVLCKIGGYLMLFSIMIVFLRHAAWMPEMPQLFFVAAMEMTTGIREVAASLPFPCSAASACAALTFGGFSGLSQTKSVIGSHEKKAGLSIRHYFLWKVFHAALSAGCFLFYP